jgi:predicted secreted protein
MADASGRFLGNDELLYVSASAPSDSRDETDYTAVGLVQTNDLEGTSETIIASDKSVSGFNSSIAGTAGYSINVTGYRKNTEDAGVKILRQAWMGQTNVYWFIGTTTAGDKIKYGQAAVTNWSEPSPTNEFATFSCTLAGQGAPTYSKAQT